MLIALGDLKVEPLVLTAEEPGREPRRSNANLVWAYSGVTVPVGLRLRVPQILLDEGPMTLGQLLKSVACEGDAAAAVTLASANLACLDLLSQPLDLTKPVRCCDPAERA